MDFWIPPAPPLGCPFGVPLWGMSVWGVTYREAKGAEAQHAAQREEQRHPYGEDLSAVGWARGQEKRGVHSGSRHNRDEISPDR